MFGNITAVVSSRATVHELEIDIYELVLDDNLTYKFGVSVIPSHGGTINNITYQLSFSGNAGSGNGADYQDGRVITISAPTRETLGTAATVTDTGGTPNARLTAAQLSGDMKLLQFTAGPLNDILGNFTLQVSATDNLGSSGSVSA